MAKKRNWTVDEVNRLIPSLTHIFQHLNELRRELSARANELESLGAGGKVSSELVRERRRIIESNVSEFHSEIKQIEEMGGLLKDLDLGLVDFPARMNGEEVLLCWQFGEPSVTHYHARNAGYRDRKAIANTTARLLN